MSNQNNEGSWMKDITEKKEVLKVLDGQSIQFTFKNNGLRKESQDFGPSIAFSIKLDAEEKFRVFYVKANNFSLLEDIKQLAKNNNGSIVDLKVEMSRKGSKKTDTKYSIKLL